MFEKKINCKYILIGIGTEFILNNYNPLYSIRVYFGKENDQKIFPLLTDRNNMCILNNKNYCNYFLQIDISDKIKKLDIYSEILDIDYPDDIKIYSNIISINDFTNKEKLLQLIPTSSNYNYKNQLNNYLQINLKNLLINENFIVLISIYSEKYSEKIVNLIPSYQNYFLKNILLQSNTPILVTSDINKEISIYTYTHENLFTYKVKRLKGDFKFNDKNSIYDLNNINKEINSIYQSNGEKIFQFSQVSDSFVALFEFIPNRFTNMQFINLYKKTKYRNINPLNGISYFGKISSQDLDKNLEINIRFLSKYSLINPILL